jgi:hypothetical protein
MKKQLALMITLCAHTALFPMFTTALKNARSLLPHINSHSRTTMLPVAHASSKDMAKLAKRVAEYKKLYKQQQRVQQQFEKVANEKDTFRGVQFGIGGFCISSCFAHLVCCPSIYEHISLEVLNGVMLVGILQMWQPSQERVDVLEKDCMRIKTELTRKLEVVEPLIQAIEQEACEGKGNSELYESMQMLRTAMEVRKQENNMIVKEKHD